MQKKIFKTKWFLLVFFMMCLIVKNIFAEEETHQIIYTVTNESDSADVMKGISLPKENIEAPDFVDVLKVSPNEPTDIGIGESKDFTIDYKIKDIVSNNGTGIVKIKFKCDPEDQLILPELKDQIVIEDTDAPTIKSKNVLPATTKADEPQSVSALALTVDQWSGIDLQQKLMVSIGNRSVLAKIVPAGTNNKECKVIANFISPDVEGEYKVVLSSIKDNAGNSSGSIELGTLKVIQSSKDQPINPDESLD